MKLELSDVTFKNFLSYGNVPQEIIFAPGINLIMGMDSGSGRSNGAGKSAAISTIPFALFGKIDKDVPKAGIVNWKNKKNCEVILSFKKGEDTYTIVRAIKPDKLEVYCNNTLMPISSNIKEYQRILEDDILGIDYNTFMYLIHTNLNSITPLLKMSAPQKRVFLERVFGLESYTLINKAANEKIRGISEKIFKQSVVVDQNAKSISDIEQQILSLQYQIGSLKIPTQNLEETQKAYDKLAQLNYTPEDMEQLVVELSEADLRKQDIITSIKSIESDIKLLAQENTLKQQHMSEQKRKQEQNQVAITDTQNKYDDFIKTKHIKTLDEMTTELAVTVNSILREEKEIQTYMVEKATITEKLRATKTTYDALKDGVCPTCDTKITPKKIQEKYVKYIDTYNTQLKDLADKIKEFADRKRKLEVEKSSKENEIESIKRWQAKEDEYKNKIKILQGVIDQGVDIIDIDTIITKNNKKIEDKNKEKSKLEAELQVIMTSITNTTQKINNMRVFFEKIKELFNKIENLNKEIVTKKEMKGNLEKLIRENDTKIKKLQKEQSKGSSSINTLKSLNDYMEYLKLLCKDDNVKQYAISSTLPYLTQQTNKYLSDSGIGYFIKFDKWVEEEIYGPGVSDASYGNLSGGESRSIDLALQFAFLDIAKVKSGIWPDVLLLDEILDSSVDGQGIANLIKIIKTKQIEDNSKIFIISHRAEIDDVVPDHTYIVSKSAGFSTIEKL